MGVTTWDSGVRSAIGGNEVVIQFTIGRGLFQILSMRLMIVQTSPKGPIPVEVRLRLKQSDGTYLSTNLLGGWVTEMHPFSLPNQPIIPGPARLMVKTVAANTIDAHRLTVTYRRVKS